MAAASRATVVPIPMKMRQMKVAQVSSPGADFQIVEREIPEPRRRTRAHQGASLRGLPQ